MCGRFVQFSSIDDIRRIFDVVGSDDMPPSSYNIAPTQRVAVIVQREGGRRLETMTWGLVPFWAKDPKIGSRMINARAESVAEKPAFRRPFRSRRCLVVADGFYEWRTEGAIKVPMYITLKSRQPFGFAGLYDTWTSPEGSSLSSCAIITTTANELTASLHDRMPVIVPRSLQGEWLDPAVEDAAELMPILAPYPAAEMEAYEVSTAVNSPRNNHPSCIEPIAA